MNRPKANYKPSFPLDEDMTLIELQLNVEFGKLDTIVARMNSTEDRERLHAEWINVCERIRKLGELSILDSKACIEKSREQRTKKKR